MQNPHAVTLKKIAEGINKDWKLDDWFQWPPDMFALCATIVNRTGLYKLCLLDPNWWNTENWKDEIEMISELWVGYTSNLLFLKPDKKYPQIQKALGKYYETLKIEWESDSPIDLDHLRALSNLYVSKPTRGQLASMKLAKALLYVYITSDVCCGGLGIIGQGLNEENLAHRNFMAVANLLLNNTGSLSTIPKFHGIVIPKMRTPQAGMVTRSLTHYLTFHITEVEVIWRTFPWLERRQKSLNILAVPYPEIVEAKDFELIPDSYQSVRFFKGKINDSKKDDKFLTDLTRTISKHAEGENIIDIVVLPEMALSEAQYKSLLHKLKDEFISKGQCARLPIIVSGVISKTEKTTGYPAVDNTFNNEVRMSVFFGGRWFNTTQRKHHRWQLDRSQIQQYELEGHFTADTLWFEYCSVSQRRLTILSPNGWLALTALICEDLARQEPLGEVIRGIGPTLLMALLSDGPQLKERWSARYASVLADDPGTAVLSLTSKGMMKRSKSPDPKDNEEPSKVVGLWKDMIRGWKELNLLDNNQAIMFSISARYQQEYTLDGRSDGELASVFQIDSRLPKQINIDANEDNFIGPKFVSPEIDLGDGTSNIRELSAVQFVIDAVLDILSNKEITKEKQKRDATKILIALMQGKPLAGSGRRKFRSRISEKISQAWLDPKSHGLMATPGADSAAEMTETITLLEKIIDATVGILFENTIKLYIKLIDECEAGLEVNAIKPTHEQVYSSILYNLYNRISTWHPSSGTGFEISGLTVRLAMKLKERILNVIHG